MNEITKSYAIGRIAELEETLEPFNDPYFKGLDSKTIAELAKKSIRLTTYNRKLEDALQDIKEKCNEARRTGRKSYLPIDILDVITKAEVGEWTR